MSTYWICDRTDERFDDYNAAWEHYQERYANDCLGDYFINYVSYDNLLKWAMKQDAFWYDAKMQNYYNRAESDGFEDQYIEHEVEDEE